MTVNPLTSPLRADLKRSDLLNSIAKKIGAKNYLEIGVQTGSTFYAVEVADKTGVDPDPASQATLIMTSDFFFEMIEEDQKFDLIYVDGLHEWETALRDIHNAKKHLSKNGVIVIDDIAPKKRAHQTRKPTAIHWTGDVWISWVFACADLSKEFDLLTVDIAFGQGVLAPKKYRLTKDPIIVDKVPNRLDWDYYKNNSKDFHKMSSFEAFQGLEWC